MNPVTLWDGRTVPSDSPEWLQECELRGVLAMSADRRARHMALVLKIRGTDGHASLKAKLAAAEPMYVLRLPDRAARNAYCADVARERGLSARRILEDQVRALWSAEKVAALAVEGA